MNQIILTKEMLNIQTVIAHENLKYKSYENEALSGMVYQLSAYIPSQVLEERSIRYPSNWIEAIKERWYPNWLKKYYPIKFTTETIKASMVYPKFVIPNQEKYLIIVHNKHDYLDIDDE